MIRVPCEVRKSEIHGMGVFAVEAIRAGRVVWAYEPGMDFTITDYVLRSSDPFVAHFIKERGYINPTNPQVWVVCIDEGQWLNFPKKDQEANLKLGGVIDGENVLLAARQIEPGEELTVPAESDLDYKRKMNLRE